MSCTWRATIAAESGRERVLRHRRQEARLIRMCLAIPGKIVEILPGEYLSAVVEVVGVRRRVELGLIEQEHPEPGDWVLIHVGFAMSKISEQDAIDQMRMLALLGEDEAAMEEMRGYTQ